MIHICAQWLLIITLVLGIVADAAAAERPNVVLILLDDVGTEAVSAYGEGQIPTPHIDRIAQQGVRFDRAFATPVCTPSRVQLLTGRYPFANGVRKNLYTYPLAEQLVAADQPSLGRHFAAQQYRTVVAGKWQLCRFDQAPSHAADFGFQRSLLWTWRLGNSSGKQKPSRYWAPKLWIDGQAGEPQAASVFGPDLYAEAIIETIQAESDQPFFAYYPMTLPHLPLIPVPGKENQFAQLNDDQKWAAMMMYADHLIGRIDAALRESPHYHNTIFVVTSDNGTPASISVASAQGPIAGGKGSLTDRGTRVPQVVRWPARITGGQVFTQLTDLPIFFPV